MEIKTCDVRECGARVLVVEVEGRPFVVNPAGAKTVVSDGAGKFRIVDGYHPHAFTWVDVSARRAARAAGGEV